LAIVVVATGFKMYKADLEVNDTYIGSVSSGDAKNGSYMVEGDLITLKDGYYEKEAATGSASKTIIRYFGNDVSADLNGDGIKDSAFLLTQEGGGSGTFYYLAALISSGKTFIGTNTVLLGDRIAPQTTEFRDGAVIVNYADRKAGEPFTAQPSVGVSRYFKLVEGGINEVVSKMDQDEARKIAEGSCIKGGEALSAGYYNENSKTWWFDANLNATRPGCSPACVVSEETKNVEINWRCTGLIAPTDN
jgi:hypothetical protein